VGDRNTKGVSPEKRQQIVEDWLRGNSFPRLAKMHRLSRACVHNIVTDARRDLQTDTNRTADEVLAEVALLRAEAWRKHQESSEPVTTESVQRVFATLGHEAPSDAQALGMGKSGKRKTSKKLSIAGAVEHTVKFLQENRKSEPSWLHIVQWCLQFEAKIRGMNAPIQVDHSFRVAGLEPEELDGEMFGRLAAALERRGAKPVEGRVLASKIIEATEVKAEPANGNGKHHGNGNGKHHA